MRGEWRVASGESTPPRHYRDLHVWQRSLDLSEAVYRATAAWPREEQYGLTSQVRRAGVSVVANIAEGAARRTPRDFLHFLSISKGSLAELETLILLAGRLDLLPREAVERLLSEADEVSRMLSGLAASLRTKL